ncbi:MAG TPA: ATP-binding cassette domain-containing protein [Propionibacteriaceae bacterium]|nr:ATP-binding cassette domain-containing protein [Propionibacteriaceae bacterium]
MSAPTRAAVNTELAIKTVGLRKTYRTRRGRQIAVNHLNLEVPRGGVHGFLGPNGSGKTTTIRMLLGLISADEGDMQILGRTVPDQLPDVIGKIGAIVESPKFFPTFSGRLNLELAADAIGVDRKQVGHVLEQVGLADRARDNFGTYSLGMKQRLAIAGTLLKDPEVLIFDEPTNGLDPAGIHEIRQTMRGLGAEGRTVLVSSHILSEVEQVADTVSIIGRGQLLASGTVAEVIGRAGAATGVRVGVAETARAAGILQSAGLVVRPDGPGIMVEHAPDPAVITKLLADHGLFVNHLEPVRRDLEAVFLELTQGQGPTASIAPPEPAPARHAPAQTWADSDDAR